MNGNEIKYIYIFDNLYITVKGKGLSTNCVELKNEISRIIDENLGIKKVYLYLKECEYMDSTFMGILVGIRNRVVEDNEGDFLVIKPSKAVWTILSEMGIALLVTKVDTDVDFPEEETMLKSQTGTEEGEDILKAHQNLADINEANKQKFSLLIELLSKMKED